MTTPAQNRLTQAVQNAQATVRRAHGPDHPGAGKLLRMTWDLRIPTWEHHWYLGLPRRIASVSQVTVEGDVVPASELVLGSDGFILSRLWVRWFGEVVADCVALDDRVTRDGMVQDLATLWLHNPDAPPEREYRILNRLPRAGAVARQPVSVVVIDEE